MSNRKYTVGRTTVFVDSHRNPYGFERDGQVVSCVCDEAAGLMCRSHAGRLVPDVLTQADQVLAAVEQREAQGHWEPSPTGRFGVVRWQPVPGAEPPQETT